MVSVLTPRPTKPGRTLFPKIRCYDTYCASFHSIGAFEGAVTLLQCRTTKLDNFFELFENAWN